MHYETRKNLWLVAVALVFAAVAALLATRWMQTRVAEVEASKKMLAPVLVAARDVPMGKRIEADDVRLVRTSAEGVPSDAYRQQGEVIGQVTRSQFYAGEMLIARRLSKYAGGSALAAVVSPDMRAVTVRVDDVIGVGGFILPENRVDVIAAYRDGSSSRAETILRDVRVLAVDQRSTPESDAPLLSRAVTLEVTPEGAELITAAKQRGSLQLTLRNPLTSPLPDSLVARNLEQSPPLVITTAMTPIVLRPVRAPAPAVQRPRDDAITLIRGTAITTRIPE